MGRLHDTDFPGENAAYREARDELLEAEIELRRLTEKVSAMRRGLPPGGKLAEDYVFEEGARDLADRESVRRSRVHCDHPIGRWRAK